MGRTGLRSPSFSLQRVSNHVRVRSQPSKLESALDFISKSDEFVHGVESCEEVLGRRIMVVVDSTVTVEAKCALQWTLSHSVSNQDTIVLLYVTKCYKQGKKCNKKTSRRIYHALQLLKNMCLMERPEVQVEISIVEGTGTEKGATIVEQIKKQRVSLLVLGQRKISIMWRVVMKWRRNRSKGGVVDYCIENASCMTVAVRKKRRMGGYLLTTRRHKDFWLLA